MSGSTGSSQSVERARAGDDGPDAAPSLRLPVALLVLWMTSGLGFAAVAVALAAGASWLVLALAASLWLGTGLLGVPVMVYDAWEARGTEAAAGFRFDSLVTALVFLLIYPLGALLYVVVRVQGPYLVAMGLDPDGMDFDDELQFTIREVGHPTAGGVTSPWTAMLVLFLWLGVLVGDGTFVVALLGDGGGVLVAAGVAVVMRLVATPALLLDCYLATTSGAFDRTTAVALAATTTVLFPVAAVGYLPYRLLAAYG